MAKETKAEWLQKEVAQAVRAGKAFDVETVDYSDPNRPLTCLEVDFPIIPINQIATIEGNAGKPIYQMSKWWARRRSSVFRAMLLASAIKAPEDKGDAAKAVWDVYYGNHQKKGIFNDLKVADIFMGGGTTVVEGSRLGMQMYGNDLNPVAWFIVKNEMAQVEEARIEEILEEIEEEVKPKIMPYYSCDCPRGCKGKWIDNDSGTQMPQDFDPFAVPFEERGRYRYKGAEMIYAFWAKHGQCTVTGCNHRTPIMNSPVVATKILSNKYWDRICSHCGEKYELEEKDARMAPASELVVSDSERAFAVVDARKECDEAKCPHCGRIENIDPTWRNRIKPKKKKINLSLLIHPKWLKGESSTDADDQKYGGSPGDDVQASIRWNLARQKDCSLIEYRGKLPTEVSLTDGSVINTGTEGGTMPANAMVSCSSCGTTSKTLSLQEALGKVAPSAMYAVQGYCPECDENGELYRGRFFTDKVPVEGYNQAIIEWDKRKDGEFKGFWPDSDIPYGERTHIKDPLDKHGYRKWKDFFNEKQLLTLSTLHKKIASIEDDDEFYFLLGAFQQYLRNQNTFCFWDIGYDKLCPHLSNSNFNPKNRFIENSVFSKIGRGNWSTQKESLLTAMEWKYNPWEIVSNQALSSEFPQLKDELKGKSSKAFLQDNVTKPQELNCESSTDLCSYAPDSLDLVITDPPFGGILQYAELSDFFYTWISGSCSERSSHFRNTYAPKAVEAVGNTARHEDPEEFYKKIMTSCWGEAHRVLKSSGILAFTFHHSKDEAWVSVLESLFDAGFYLQATYPIRSDETKGDGEFGSKKIEYDIIHVCRKRLEETAPISWARLRRQVLQDVRRLQDLLEHHQMEGLPDADIQVIRRGKALEYFSKHYGKVFKSEGEVMGVREALVGVNQLLEEETGEAKTVPPHEAESFTRMLLRLFDSKNNLERDQIQKFLRGSGASPGDFLSRGWCIEKKKVFSLRPMPEMAKELSDKHIQRITCDYEQAALLIGACFEDSGINVTKLLNDKNFKPHPALKSVLEWFWDHGADGNVGAAARKASDIYSGWLQKHKPEETANLFDFFGES